MNNENIEINSGEDSGEEIKVGQSPTPEKITDIESPFVEPKKMDFYEALAAIMKGNKVSKLEWEDKEYYGIIDKGILKLHKPTGKLYNWTLSDGDILGTDYVIIN